MGTVTTSNPLVFNGSGGTITGLYYVRLIQWVDDANDVGDNDDLTLIINGVTLLVSCADASVKSPMIWELGPFNPGIPVRDITATIDTGNVHVWVD